MTDYEEFQAHGLTSQSAVAAVGNRYDLVLIAGDAALVASRHGPILTALKEIEAKKVGREYLLKDPDIAPRRRTWPTR